VGAVGSERITSKAGRHTTFYIFLLFFFCIAAAQKWVTPPLFGAVKSLSLSQVILFYHLLLSVCALSLPLYISLTRGLDPACRSSG